MILVHGTTRWRAEQILLKGPVLRFREPGGLKEEDEISMYLESGPFWFGDPEEYARGKAREFPAEGPPVILALDVPDDVVDMAVEKGLPLNQGLVQFGPGRGLEELLAQWPTLAQTAEIRSLP